MTNTISIDAARMARFAQAYRNRLPEYDERRAQWTAVIDPISPDRVALTVDRIITVFNTTSARAASVGVSRCFVCDSRYGGVSEDVMANVICC
jgi:hypothetical protein